MSTIFDAKFKADTKELDAASKSLGNLADKVPGLNGRLKELQNVFKGVGAAGSTSVIAVTALAAAAVAAAGTFIKLGLDAINAADALDEMSAASGRSVEELQAYEAVISLTKGSLDSYLVMLDKVSTKMAKTDGVDAFSQALKYFGVSLTDVNGQMKTSEQISTEVAQRFSEMPVTVSSTAAVTEILTKNYKDNIEAAKEMANKQEFLTEKMGLGAIVSTESAKQAAEYKDQTTKLGWAIDGLANDSMAALLPVLQTTVDLLLAAAKASREVTLWFDNLSPSTTKLSGSLTTMNGSLGKAVELFQAYLKLRGQVSQSKESKVEELMTPPKSASSPGNTPDPNGVFDPNAAQKAEEAARKAASAAEKAQREALQRQREHNRAMAQAEEERIKAIKDFIKEQQDAINGMNGDIANDQQREIDKWAEITRRIKDSVDPLQKYRDQLTEIQTAREKGLITADEETEALMNVQAAIEQVAFGTKDIVDKQKDMWESLQQAIEGYTQKMGDAFVDFAMGAKTSFGSLVSDILQQLARMVANEAFKKMFDMFKGGTSGGSSSGGFLQSIGSWIGSFFKNGAAFDGGGIAKFASGDVFDSPTRFGYGNGKQGEMGEAGPEAVMPLTRMSNGKLGVQSSGNNSGSTTINNISITVSGGNNPDETAEKTRQATLKAMQQVADSRIANSQRSGGLLQPVGATAF